MLNPTPQRLRRGTRSPTTDPPSTHPGRGPPSSFPGRWAVCRRRGHPPAAAAQPRAPGDTSGGASGAISTHQHRSTGEASHLTPHPHQGRASPAGPPTAPPLPQSQCAHLPFWQRCGVRAERPAGTPRLCSAELRFTCSVTAGMNISWHALRDGSRELFMAHLETELMAREWAAARPPPG